MKRIKVLALAAGLVITGLSASAQKIAAVDMDGLVYSLPEIQTVQKTMQTFQQDSIGGEYTRLSKELHDKDSVYKDAKTSASVKATLEKEMAPIQNTLMGWQQIAGELNQQKQQQLLAPLYNKVHQAITAVAKEKGYAYVLQIGAFIVAPEADNISLAVAQKLGIKVDQGAGAPAGGAAPASGTKAPAKVPAKTPAKK
ncbi:OmpH family outer membrane protein [Niabella soli]|uniref:OmpH family outer membrane protein n=1 Tax=Niabella soli TaxID=446683 RepID=UPI0002499944|nr:OmpH family outer membrane protein [Niabella soli]